MCSAAVKDIHIYYHGVVIPGGAYVIDSSEEESVRGDEAHECLLEVFKGLLGEELGCDVIA